MVDERFPVCSPALAIGPPALGQPSALAAAILLHNGAHPGEWAAWPEAAGVEGVPADRGPVLDASNEVLAAAASSMGVALGRRPLVDADLAAGRLVAPFDVCVRTPGRYWLVAPEATAERPALAAFRRWLREQVHAAPTSR